MSNASVISPFKQQGRLLVLDVLKNACAAGGDKRCAEKRSLVMVLCEHERKHLTGDELVLLLPHFCIMLLFFNNCFCSLLRWLLITLSNRLLCSLP